MVSCLVTLVFGEAILRFAAHRLLRGGEWLAAGQIFKIIDPPVGFSLQPGATQILVTGKAYTSRATINSQGLRDIEHPLRKPPGQRRILVLGDSFMFGQGVRMQESLPRQLAGQLPGVDVINAGIPGYSLGQEYLYFKDRGYQFEPDLVLLGFFINDLARARELDETDGPDGLPISFQRTAQMVARDREQAPHGVRGAVSSFLNSHSLLYVLVRRHMENLMAHRGSAARTEEKGNAEPYYLSVFRDDASPGVVQDWEKAYRTLDELKRDVAARGARLAVILVPAPFQISDKEFHDWLEWSGAAGQAMSRRKPQDMVLDWCRRTTTPCDDLLEAFENQDREKYYYPYDLHWTREGHELAARSVAGFLAANKLP
jgi:lysophospholipase L1-like esterase